MKCKKCIYCIYSGKDSYIINCEKFGDDTREADYCVHYITRKDFIKRELKKLEEKTRL